VGGRACLAGWLLLGQGQNGHTRKFEVYACADDVESN
jgi:hypothetical protein